MSLFKKNPYREQAAVPRLIDVDPASVVPAPVKCGLLRPPPAHKCDVPESWLQRRKLGVKVGDLWRCESCGGIYDWSGISWLGPYGHYADKWVKAGGSL